MPIALALLIVAISMTRSAVISVGSMCVTFCMSAANFICSTMSGEQLT